MTSRAISVYSDARNEGEDVAMPGMIAYECDASEHQTTDPAADKLTIYEGAWAFCRFDAMAVGHHWRATGGEELDAVMRRSGLSALRKPVTR